MFILKFAKNFFDQIFNCHQTFGSRIFVDDNGQVHPLGPHIRQQIQYATRGGHIKRLTDQLFVRCQGLRLSSTKL